MRRCRPVRPASGIDGLDGAVAASLGGCQTAGIVRHHRFARAARRRTRTRPDSRQAVDAYGERYRANPRIPRRAALRPGAARHRPARPGRRRARAGHDRQSRQQGVARRPTAARSPKRQLPAGASTCSAAPTRPDNPDWRILSVQGTALDQLGRHDEARRYYASALKIVPDEPSVLSNLGLSYMLSKDLPKAEDDAAPRLRQRRRRRAGAAESGAGGRPAGTLRRSRDDRPAPICRPTRRRPMSPI